MTCKPLEGLNDVLNWTSDNIKRKYRIKKLILNQNQKFQQKVKIILCHDMKNNYLEDKYYQGTNEKDAFRYYDWNLIEYFIYFSHHFITIPTESWINASHNNNVPILATLITEHQQGYDLCERFLSDKSLIEKFVSKLVDITIFYGFDGWLLNIENKIKQENIENLIYFTKLIVSSLRAVDSTRYKVIWYDSVIENGELHWQNELNELNECFFKETDAIFINYTWKNENIMNSVLNAKERLNDVYIGIDVFGRNCFGGGGYNCNLAFNEICNANLNAALFAPGWVLECNDGKMFVENQLKFWCLIESFAVKQRLSQLPLLSTFNQGCGNGFWVNGEDVGSADCWYNLNLQALQPSISNGTFEKCPISWCFSDAYYGGSCIEVPKDVSMNLFDLNVELSEKQVVKVKYCFKKSIGDDGNMFLRLVYSHGTRFCNLGGSNEIESEEFNVQSFQQTLNSSNWIVREYILDTNKSIGLNGLEIHNESVGDVKLGFLSIMPLKHDFDTKISNFSLKNSKCIRLDNKHYFFVETDWEFSSKCQDEFGYFNLFLKFNDDVPYKYIGSTTSQDYYLCLELENFYFNYSKDSDYNTEKNKACKLLVQFVNEYIDLKDFGDENLTLEIELPGRGTIKRVVYDFENIF
jgi:mannosyl-glycoprotein endo-beta-N-acetylglucosaminidase